VNGPDALDSELAITQFEIELIADDTTETCADHAIGKTDTLASGLQRTIDDLELSTYDWAGGSEVSITIPALSVTNNNDLCPTETTLEFKSTWDEWVVIRTQDMVTVDLDSAEKTVTITLDQKQYLTESLFWDYGVRKIDDSAVTVEGRFVTKSVVT
jgi:hypothetical protein